MIHDEYLPKYIDCLQHDVVQRFTCLHEIDAHLAERQNIFISVCTCKGGAEAERDQSNEICDTEFAEDDLLREVCKEEVVNVFN